MPDNLPAAPLKALLARAAKTLPAVTGETARAADAARRRAAGEALTLLCDTSGSMAADAGGRPAIAHLREAVDGVLADLPHARLVAFSSSARVCGSAADLPAPSGGTALHAGLDEAAKGRPEKIVVVSDGEPDDEAAALRAAARCGCRIDVIYCGPDGGAGLAFLRRLAAAAGGEVVTCDLVGATRLGRDRPLLTQVRRLAGLPAPALTPPNRRASVEDLIFESDGPRLAASNYWGSSYDLAGYLFVSLNAGAFRVLVPSGGLPGGKIRDLKCKRVVVSRGRWPAQRRDDAVELLFDDGSDSPFALHLGLQQFDRLPAPEDEGRDDFRCLVYTGGAGLPPRLRHDLPAAYRRVRSIPDLSPWRSRPC